VTSGWGVVHRHTDEQPATASRSINCQEYQSRDILYMLQPQKQQQQQQRGVREAFWEIEKKRNDTNTL